MRFFARVTVVGIIIVIYLILVVGLIYWTREGLNAAGTTIPWYFLSLLLFFGIPLLALLLEGFFKLLEKAEWN